METRYHPLVSFYPSIVRQRLSYIKKFDCLFGYQMGHGQAQHRNDDLPSVWRSHESCTDGTELGCITDVEYVPMPRLQRGHHRDANEQAVSPPPTKRSDCFSAAQRPQQRWNPQMPTPLKRAARYRAHAIESLANAEAAADEATRRTNLAI